ncbi:MAG: hypothetical protein JSS81_17505 [Acidobacteria bacterium]|nr:hypothetical protein [Acidobacteriota bacterium]
MKKLTIIFALVVIGLTAQSGFGQTTGDDRANLIRAARFLEEKPFDKDAPKMREWAFLYVAQTKDVSVVICAGPLIRPMLEKKNKYGDELLNQYAIAMAAFKLQNPDRKSDENAAQLAGLESALKAYEKMVAGDSKAKYAALDELLAKRDKGELKALVEAADCAKK